MSGRSIFSQIARPELNYKVYKHLWVPLESILVSGLDGI